MSVSAPQRARNEHKGVEVLRRETVLSDSILSRSYTGGAGVRERSALWRERSGRKRESQSGHAFQATDSGQTVHTCVSGVNGQKRSEAG